MQWHLEFNRVNHGLLQSKRLLAYKVTPGIIHVTSCRNPCWKGDWKCFLLFLYVQFVLVQQVREAERTTGGCSSEGIHRDHQNCSRANTRTRIKSTSGKPSFCLPLHSIFGCWFICKWTCFSGSCHTLNTKALVSVFRITKIKNQNPAAHCKDFVVDCSAVWVVLVRIGC